MTRHATQGLKFTNKHFLKTLVSKWAGDKKKLDQNSYNLQSVTYI